MAGHNQMKGFIHFITKAALQNVVHRSHKEKSALRAPTPVVIHLEKHLL